MLAGAADAAIIPTGIGGFIACKVGGWERGQGDRGRGRGGCQCGNHPDGNRGLYRMQGE